MKIYLFPPPALPGSGKMGMISARCFKAPLDNVGAKIGFFIAIQACQDIFLSYSLTIGCKSAIRCTTKALQPQGQKGFFRILRDNII